MHLARPSLVQTAATWVAAVSFCSLIAACSGGGGTPESPAEPPAVADPTAQIAHALDASSSFHVDGIATMPAAAPANGAATTGRVFFIDSRAGDDNNDGLQAEAGTAGRGPWKSLQRLQRSGIGPGDQAQLACGSVWSETLRLPASGTVAMPIVVRAPRAGCSQPPAIDGSIALTAWTPHSGAIYKTTLGKLPLQLLPSLSAPASSVSAATWSEAHHPNRGYLANDPDSPYLATAADSAVNGSSGSSTLISGRDLVLPAGASLVGAGVRIRTYPWWMDESTVSAVSGSTVALARPTVYPLGTGWGYYFTGKLWMVDSPGEWSYDGATSTLYAYMPGGTPPADAPRATVLDVAIDLHGMAHVVIDGLVVRRVGVGLDLRDATQIALRNAGVEDVWHWGVDASGSNAVTVESSSFTRIGLDAVSGWRHGLGRSVGLTARNNLIREAGVLMNGDKVLNQPRMALAAILGGESATITGNTILNAGYIGILVGKNSLIENNFVYGACTVLDDCGGIFLQYAGANGTVRGNTVVHSRGAMQGKAAWLNESQGQGIYLDESASGVLVEDNTVIDADNGILLHVASRNTVRGNRLYANRRSQIWMQATRNVENPNGDLVDNVVVDNQLAAVNPGAVGLFIDTSYASTAAFGTIDRNRYLDRAAPVAVLQITSGGVSRFSFDGWRRSTDPTLPTGHDANGSASSLTAFAYYTVAGASVVPNGRLAANANGWSTWNATAPLGRLAREACPAGDCLRYTAGGSPGLISAPSFSIVAGQWYRLSIDVATEQEGQAVQLAVRRGGGGNNGYDSVIDRQISLRGSRSWTRYSVHFQATTTVNVNDPVTGDLGARIDIDPVSAGGTLSLANLELVPITPDPTVRVSGTLVNAGRTARSQDCPFTGTQSALCAKMVNLSDHRPVSWPLSLAAHSAAVLYAQEPALADSDGDGIADSQDSCPGGTTGVAVDATGCPLRLR